VTGPGPLVVVGDTLVDRDLDGTVDRLAPDAPVPVVADPSERARAGGAGLAAVLAAADGRPVTLVTALGDDAAGRDARRLLGEAGVDVVDLGTAGQTAEKVRVRTGGRSLLRLDYGGDASPPLGWSAAGGTAVAGAAAVLVSDYGRGLAAHPSVRAALADAARRTPLVWDPHPRGAVPVPGARLATPNRSEAAPDGPGLGAVATAARRLAAAWRAAGVAVTLGSAGALYVEGDGPPLVVPTTPADGDPCGAGDRFASAAAGVLADGGLPSEAVTVAVERASLFVAAGGVAAVGRPGAVLHRLPGPAWPPGAGAVEVATATRAAGGTVVATGGCFDLLHAGHVQVLDAARALGDCLVVCLNSDDSVRRLKGEGRPLVPAADRAAVLASLACVDAVHVFEEDTPEAALDLLRPHVWAKGGDYAGADLPEAAVLARWGGTAVVLPYLEGRSTSRLVAEVARRA
jgi:D-beta-D-heptose 7-phosphate kinase / D-beta-D-heptose 1-phosphate adenosyltransferase